MKKTETEWRELRWRTKGTFGLVVLGAFFGAVAWLWRGGLEHADAARIFELLSVSAGNLYFWIVVAASGALGGWLAWMIFWRGRAVEAQAAPGLGGFDGPKF